MNPLELYLQRVARELRCMPAAKRDDELRELRSHLEQRTQDFALQGMSVPQAQTLALDEFGAPRALGAKLCDAWEGVPFSPGRLLLALGGVTVFWFGSIALFTGAMLLLICLGGEESYPYWQYECALTFATSRSFCSGWLFSHWLGRRGPIVSCLYFLTLFLLLQATHHLGISEGTASIPIQVWHTLLAVTGAVWGQARRKRSQRLALSSGHTLGSVSTSPWRWPRLAFRSCLTFAVVTGVWTVIMSYMAKRAMEPVHNLGTSLRVPYTYSTIEHAVKLHRGDPSFQAPYDYSRDFSVSLLKMRQLPPTTAAERVGQEKRVYFFLQIKAREQHIAQRIAFLKRELASPQERRKWGERALLITLNRLQRNDQNVYGIAHMVQTPTGWQVDESSFDRTKLWSWCNDVSLEGVMSSATEVGFIKPVM